MKYPNIFGFIRLIRPINCIMMGLAVVTGAALVTSLNSPIPLLLGFSTSFMLTGASMAINDYCDQSIDSINEPTRPIPSGAVTPKGALVFALVLSAAGFVAAIGTSVPCLLIAMIAWIVSISYAAKGKETGLLGNWMVSVCVVIPFLYGSVVVENLNSSIAIFVAIVFLSNTGREITKGIMDVKGDALRNIKTIALMYGEKNAAVISFAFFVSAVSLTPLPWLLGNVSNWFLPVVVLTDIGLVSCSFSLIRNYSRDNARLVKNLILLWFATGLFAFLVGTL